MKKKLQLGDELRKPRLSYSDIRFHNASATRWVYIASVLGHAQRDTW